jgi:hypothetical protein
VPYDSEWRPNREELVRTCLQGRGRKSRQDPRLKGRWLAHADDDPDAGYTISLWENDAAMRTYESGEVLQNTISAAAEAVFLWRLHHNPLRKYGLRRNLINPANHAEEKRSQRCLAQALQKRIGLRPVWSMT